MLDRLLARNQGLIRSALIGLILLLQRTAFLPESLAIPAGIGISFHNDNSTLSDLKSSYVMVDDASRKDLTEAFDLQFMSATAIGDLYRNVAMSCSD